MVVEPGYDGPKLADEENPVVTIEFVREMVEDMRIRVPFVSTIDNLADFFTKPLPAKSFYAMRDQIMNVPPGQRMSATPGSAHGGVLNEDSGPNPGVTH